MKEILQSLVPYVPFIYIWILFGISAVVWIETDSDSYDFSRLQRIAFYIITGPAGWVVGIWKLLGLY